MEELDNSELDLVEAGMSGHFQPAGFWIRFGAYFVDVLILFPFLSVPMIYSLMILKSLPLILFLSALSVLYKPLMEWKFGATLGKMALKVRVVDSETFENISIDQAALRFIPFLIPVIISVVYMFSLFNDPEFIVHNEAETYMIYVQERAKDGPVIDLLNSLAGWLPVISGLFVFTHPRRFALHDRIGKTCCIMSHNYPKNRR